jgi:hypothetical protein
MNETTADETRKAIERAFTSGIQFFKLNKAVFLHFLTAAKISLHNRLAVRQPAHY